MSAPDPQGANGLRPEARVELASGALDVVQLSSPPGRAQALEHLVRARGLGLPAVGHARSARGQLLLAVRPGRWWWVAAPAASGCSAGDWQRACADTARVVDLSSAVRGLQLTGSAAAEVLRRFCRLDLHPSAFAPGKAAATLMAQLPVVLVALGSGWLLLTPASTAHDLVEALERSASPFGVRRGEMALEALWSLENLA